MARLQGGPPTSPHGPFYRDLAGAPRQLAGAVTGVGHYYLHIGASLLPRRGLQPLTLAEAIHRAYGHQYAIVYRVAGGKAVPIVANAGADEVVFVPTGRRVPRDAVAWDRIISDVELWLTMMGPP